MNVWPSPPTEEAALRVLLVDDHAVVREGTRRLLERRPGLRVVAEAGDAQSALQACRDTAIDLAVTDLNLPDIGGIELIGRLLQRHPALRLVVFSMHRDSLHATQALRAGARGYVTKSAPPEELVQAVAAVGAGRRFLSSDLAPHMALELLDGDEHPAARLNAREFEVLRLLLQGLEPAAIGQRLSLSPKTVQNLHYQIKTRLAVRNDIELTRLAWRWGLLDEPGGPAGVPQRP